MTIFLILDSKDISEVWKGSDKIILEYHDLKQVIIMYKSKMYLQINILLLTSLILISSLPVGRAADDEAQQSLSSAGQDPPPSPENSDEASSSSSQSASEFSKLIEIGKMLKPVELRQNFLTLAKSLEEKLSPSELEQNEEYPILTELIHLSSSNKFKCSADDLNQLKESMKTLPQKHSGLSEFVDFFGKLQLFDCYTFFSKRLSEILKKLDIESLRNLSFIVSGMKRGNESNQALFDRLSPLLINEAFGKFFRYSDIDLLSLDPNEMSKQLQEKVTKSFKGVETNTESYAQTLESFSHLVALDSEVLKSIDDSQRDELYSGMIRVKILDTISRDQLDYKQMFDNLSKKAPSTKSLNEQHEKLFDPEGDQEIGSVEARLILQQYVSKAKSEKKPVESSSKLSEAQSLLELSKTDISKCTIEGLDSIIEIKKAHEHLKSLKNYIETYINYQVTSCTRALDRKIKLEFLNTPTKYNFNIVKLKDLAMAQMNKSHSIGEGSSGDTANLGLSIDTLSSAIGNHFKVVGYSLKVDKENHELGMEALKNILVDFREKLAKLNDSFKDHRKIIGKLVELNNDLVSQCISKPESDAILQSVIVTMICEDKLDYEKIYDTIVNP